MHIGCLLFILMSVLLRTATCIAAEVVTEECGTGEIVFVCKVDEGDVRLQQVEAYLHDGIGVDGLLGRLAVTGLYDVRQVTGGDAEFVGIESYAARLAVMFAQ